MDEKTCRDCGEAKPLDAFPLQKGGRLGRHPLCKPCRAAQERERYHRSRGRLLDQMRSDPARKVRGRRRRLRTAYGLTDQDLGAMLRAQCGRCAICGDGGRLQIDHDHETGAVRGLLCPRCNIAIGTFDDDRSRLLAAARYLETVG